MDKTVILARPAISIIVPVYNVEKYLERCLDSIFKQQFSCVFEVIAVEDCSTDNSLHVLKEYQKREKRLRIIEHELNRKVSISRSTGLKSAIGEYVMFVDSDDCLLPCALKNLYEKCIETDADVIVYNYIIFDEHDNRKVIKNIESEFTTTQKSIVSNHFFGALWNKIIKRSLVENLVCGHVELSISEDLLYGTEILIKAKKICLIPEPYYLYFINKNSLTNLVKSDHFLQNQIIVLSQIEIIRERYKIDLQLSNMLLNYFEKWIYIELAKIHYWKVDNLANCAKSISELFQFSLMTPSRRYRLNLSIKNKFICLLEVTFRCGFRISWEVIRRSINKKN